jgi:hypothetical protein
MGQRIKLKEFLSSYSLLVVVFITITLLSAVTTVIAFGNEGVSNILQVSPKSPWGILTSLFMNYKIENLFTNVGGLAFYFFFLSCASAFLANEERKSRIRFFSGAILAAGIVANMLFLLMLYFWPLLGASSGTSAVVYGVEGTAVCLALINLVNLKKASKTSKLPIIFFNAILIIMPAYELYGQITNVVQVYITDQVNVLVHYYAFCAGFLFCLFWKRSSFTNLFVKKKED